MAQLENGNPVSLQELMVSTLAMTDALAKLLIEKWPHHGCGVQAEGVRGACGLPADFEPNNAVIVLEKRRQPHVSTQVAARGELMAKY